MDAGPTSLADAKLRHRYRRCRQGTQADPNLLRPQRGICRYPPPPPHPREPKAKAHGVAPRQVEPVQEVCLGQQCPEAGRPPELQHHQQPPCHEDCVVAPPCLGGPSEVFQAAADNLQPRGVKEPLEVIDVGHGPEVAQRRDHGGAALPDRGHLARPQRGCEARGHCQIQQRPHDQARRAGGRPSHTPGEAHRRLPRMRVPYHPVHQRWLEGVPALLGSLAECGAPRRSNRAGYLVVLGWYPVPRGSASLENVA